MAKRMLVAWVIASTLAVASPAPDGAADSWVGTWAASPQLTEDANLPPAPAVGDTTLRQVVRVSIGGRRLRVRVSNAFGKTPLTVLSAHVARSARRGW